MRVKSLIEELQHGYDPEDEVFVLYWDRFIPMVAERVEDDNLDPVVAQELWHRIVGWVEDDDMLDLSVGQMVSDALMYYYDEAVGEVAESLNEDCRD